MTCKYTKAGPGNVFKRVKQKIFPGPALVMKTKTMQIPLSLSLLVCSSYLPTPPHLR
jgi:hypothetical protein